MLIKLNANLLCTASPELEVIKYTGTSGLYSAVQPDDKTNAFLVSIAGRLGYKVDPSKLHCTIMYSATACPKRAYFDSSLKYSAEPTHINHWIGHDGKGYLTLAMRSPELLSEHIRLKNLGCRPDFDYNPHVTLWADVPLTKDLKRKIAVVSATKHMWPLLRFTNQFIGDLKD